MSSEDSSSEASLSSASAAATTTAASDASDDLLFKDVKFRLCDDLTDSDTIRKILVDGGGKLVNYMSDLCTHLIADTDDHPEVTEALEIYEKPVVTSCWVHASKSAGILLPVKGFSPSKKQLFSNVIACPSNLSPDDLTSIWAMITFYGGSFSLTLTPDCTHLISTKPEGKKYDKVMSLSQNDDPAASKQQQDIISIVTPDWVVDSVRNKSICDEELYHPRLLILPSNVMMQRPATAISLQSIEPDLIIKSNVTSSNPNSLSSSNNLSGQSIVTAITTSQMVKQNMPANAFVTTVSPSGSTSNPAMHHQQQQQQQQHQLLLMQQQQHQNAARQQQMRLLVPGQQNHPVRLMPVQRQMRPQMQMQMQQQQQQQYQMDPNQPQQQVHMTSPAAGSGPRQVYLAPHQQPQVRPHQLQQQGQQQQFAQIRSQQPGSYMTAEYQQIQQQQPQPVNQTAQKPANQVILQQRVQPPVHTLSANQNMVQQQQQQNMNQMMNQQQQHQRFPNNGQPQHRPLIASGQMIRSAVQMQQVTGLGPQQVRHPQQQPQQIQQQHQMHPQGYPLQQQNIASGITGMQVQRVPQIRTRAPVPGQPIMRQQIITNAEGQRFVIRHQHPQMGQPQQQQQQFVSVNPDQMMSQTTTDYVVRHPIRQQSLPANWQQQQQTDPAGVQMVRMPQTPGQPQLVQWHQQQQPQHRQMLVIGQQQQPLQQQQVMGQDPNRVPAAIGRFPSPPGSALRFSSNTVNSDQPQQPQHMLQQSQIQSQQQLQQSPQSANAPSAASVPASAVTATIAASGTKLAPKSAPAATASATTTASTATAAAAPRAHVVPSPAASASGSKSKSGGGRVLSVSTCHANKSCSSASPVQSSSSSSSATSSSQGNNTQVTSKTKTALANLLNTRLAANNSGSSAGSRITTDPNFSGCSSSSGSSSNSSTPTSVTSIVNSFIATATGDGSPPAATATAIFSAANSCTTATSSSCSSPLTRTPCPSTSSSSCTLSVAAGPASRTITAAPPASPVVGVNPVMLPSGSLYHQIHDPPPFAEKYYVHEPSVKVPKNLCLTGFVFHLFGYQQEAGKNFQLNDNQRKHLRDRIIALGGEFEAEYSEKVTHLFTDSQKYPIAERALKEGKRLVNIYWLDEVLKEDKMRPPWRAWHLPRHGVHPTPIMKTQIIATTGFTLPERQFIRELCCFIGAKYTPYMSESNTILICKQVDSEKYAKAIEWLIPTVSGHWIVDAFFNVNDALRMPFGSAHVRHKNFDSANPFDIDFRAIRPLMSGWTKAIRVDPDRLAKLIELKSQQDLVSNNNNSSQSSGTSIVSGSSQTIAVSSGDSSVSAEHSGEVIPASQPLLSETAPQAAADMGQENRKVVNGTENSNSNGVNDDDVFTKPAAKKPRLSVDMGSKLPACGSIPPPPPLQLAPNVPMPESAVRVVFTGFKSPHDDLIDIVHKLGGKVTTNHKECTHIVVESTPTRTVKYLSALNFAHHVVHQKWLYECQKMKRFVSEQEHGFRSSKDAIKRRDDRGPEDQLLFKNIVMHITPGCIPSPCVLKTLIEMAGGVGVMSVGPTRKQLTALRLQGFDFHVITCSTDLHLCPKFREWGIRLLVPEFVMTSLMRQEMDFGDGAFDVKQEQE